MPLMARCNKCGTTFVSQLNGLQLARMANTLEDNIENCRVPGCGGWATSENVIEGRSQGIPELSEVLERMRPFDVAQLAEFRVLLQSVQQGMIAPQAARQQAAALSPGLATTFDWAFAMGAASLLVALIALYVSIATYQHDLAGDADVVAGLAQQEQALAIAKEQAQTDREILKELRLLRAAQAEPPAAESRQVRRAKKRAAEKLKGRLEP
ncbi:hypothetical protein [Phenylobacterium sp.]|uniref:hypothetical protein n=1 Tax=Phenylobacterium sp. TaxID=1871053 RepID=UPI0025F82830|nr:hypothetical protein [Phenylobacterium sp.]